MNGKSSWSLRPVECGVMIMNGKIVRLWRPVECGVMNDEIVRARLYGL